MTSDGSARYGQVRVMRGQGLDACHRVSVAVTDRQGKLLGQTGEPGLVTMTRSAIKPLQVLPLLSTGAADAFELCAEELAIAQASHDGTDEHVRWVKGLLHKAEASVGDLCCGAHLPLFMQQQQRWPSQGEDRDPLRHNCSGKHAGFLLTASHLQLDKAAYLQADAVLQVQVRAAVAEHAGLTPEQLLVGVDGCSAPNFALPLQALARAFAELACASDTAPLGRARDAALQHPHLASGHEQFDCTLMQASAGRVFCKGGAEAIMALALPAQGLGVVLKVHDGGARAIPPATLAVLQQLGVFPDGIPSALKVYQRPQLRNASGLATGELIADVPIA